MPSEVDAAYAVPDAIVRVRSSDRTVRFVTRNWRVESSPRRYKPSTIEMRSAAAMRQTGVAAPSLAVRSTSICQVRTLPRVPELDEDLEQDSQAAGGGVADVAVPLAHDRAGDAGDELPGGERLDRLAIHTLGEEIEEPGLTAGEQCCFEPFVESGQPAIEHSDSRRLGTALEGREAQDEGDERPRLTARSGHER